MIKVKIRIRRSKESGARTVSLEDQRARIADYCQGHRWTLLEFLADDGVSGGRRERLDRLMERVKATGARVVVVYHLDRFARGLAATLDYLRRFALSLRAISETLARKGVLARNGRPLAPTTLRRIVHNPTVGNTRTPS